MASRFNRDAVMKENILDNKLSPTVEKFLINVGVGQFCDDDLEVAFRSKTCYVHNLDGDDLLTGAHESNLYTLSILDMPTSSPVYLMSKATSTKSWLWHRRLSHLNFGTINHLTKQDLVDGLPKSLCYPTNDREDLGKMKPKSNIAKFTSTPSKEDLDNLFGPMYEEYFEKRYTDVSINSDAQTILNNENTHSSLSIILEDIEAPPLVSSSEEQISPMSNEVDVESVQEDSADLNGNTLITPYNSSMFEEAESSLTDTDPSNMHEFNQVQPSTHIWTKAHPLEQVICHQSKPLMTRSRLNTDAKVCIYALTVSTIESKNIKEAMMDHSWIESMQDELKQFQRLNVWELVPRPTSKNIIGVKWLWKNKTDAENTMIRNKSPLVAKGIRMVTDAYDCAHSKLHHAFKSDSSNFLDTWYTFEHVHNLKKALYGLKQAPRAWYDKLSSFLIENHFTKGIVNPALFTRCHGEDILLVQVYVDDIIFGSTNLDFSKRFAIRMKNNFEMSMMGELKFFLGLQIHQSPRRMFISQSQYTLELLKKHGMDGCDSISIPMATARLDDNLQGTPTDQTKYHSMIRGIMYLTASRPDIAFATFVCSLLGMTKGQTPERGGLQFLGEKLVSWCSKKNDCTVMSTTEAEYVSLSACCAQVIWMWTQLLDYGYRFNKLPMYCDSKSAIAISCNPVQHSRTKHINIRVAKDEIVKSIFYFRKNKEGKGMRIPDSMLIEEMKLTRHYQMYVSVFGVDVPTTQSQLIESTQGTHRTLSAPRTPHPATTPGKSSAPRKPIVIRFRGRSQPNPETLIPTSDELDITNLEEATQHLVDEEIETMVEGTKNMDEDEFMNEIFYDQKDPNTILESKSHKESLEVKKSVDILIINDDEEEESAGDELISWKGKGIEKIRDTPPPTPIRSLGLILLLYLRIRRHSRN
ncbi:retrovirus-related pol polyprotein from transposon TNT 1-94 [Tanacetum coccineum]|uniref:Retrovirus-related pol polyprotein from transposon TNT 1-94 n=1 Tax=Tanacetum coccineum TaxID=301880 RepID=A0ABQ4WPB7_9ASTR